MNRRILIFLACLTMTLTATAQAKFQTKKCRFADIRERTTKVVLSGNVMADAIFEDGVKKSWNISSYEFCDMETFNRDMTDTDTYFLLVTDSRFRKETEAGIMTIGLYKGHEKAAAGMDGLDKVTSIPYCSADGSDGSESLFLPILLHNLQNNVEAILKNDFNPGSMVKVRSGKKDWSHKVYIDSCKLGFKPLPSSMAAFKTNGIILCADSDIEKIITVPGDEALVGYSVAPVEPKDGSKCFNMLLNTMTGELYWMNSRRLSADEPAGFTCAELESILSNKK